MIIIRTDANKTIATGHMMRTLSIARVCKENNIPVMFVLSDKESASFLNTQMEENESFDIVVLNEKVDTASFHEMENELPYVLNLITTNKID